MQFQDFARAVHERFNQLMGAGSEVFRADVDADALWEVYLAAFPAGTNDIFRERAQHDCSTCRQFVRAVGGIVVLDEAGFKHSVWGLDLPPSASPYAAVAHALHNLVVGAPIAGVYRSTEPRYGVASNEEVTEHGTLTWHHFHCELPARLVSSTAKNDASEFRVSHDLLKRGLYVLSADALETVLDLIANNSLYRGEENRAAVETFASLKQRHDALFPEQREVFRWRNVGSRAARFRNSAIGTLVVDLSAGMDINAAVARFEHKVAPQNYKRSSAPITKGMVDKALAKLRDLGLESAVHRRFAAIEDVSVNDILFVDRSVQPLMKDSLADLLAGEVKPPRIVSGGAVDISGTTFFADVLPGAEAVQVQVENRHLGNLVSLTAPEHADVGQLFGWRNNFAWAYRGGVTDSIKERVKAAGGNVNALLRISLAWFNYDDLDIHCIDPRDRHIYFGSRYDVLDVDMNVSPNTREAVENLAWQYLDDGEYRVWVNNFTRRESVDVGFDIQVAYGGQQRVLNYPKALRNKEVVQVCTFQVQGGQLTRVDFASHMQDTNRAVTEWGITTNTFVDVDTVMLSPNHWGPVEHRAGNRHHIFVLRGCRNPEPVRGFFNEYLHPRLREHRKVFERLGAKLMCAPSENQLSGVGFSSTRRDRVTIRVQKDGNTRTYNVQF